MKGWQVGKNIQKKFKLHTLNFYSVSKHNTYNSPQKIERVTIGADATVLNPSRV